MPENQASSGRTDANDLIVVHGRTSNLVVIRVRGQPALEIPVSDPAKYRDKEEVSKVRKESDPIDNLRDKMIAAKVSNEEALKEIDKDIKATVTAAAEFAQQSEEPDPSELFTDILLEA